MSRIEMLIDGAVAGQARIGLPQGGSRTDPELAADAAGALAGFAWTPEASDLPSDRDRIEVRAQIVTVAGDRLDLPGSQEIQLASPEPAFSDTGGYARRLRARIEGRVRRRAPRRDGALRLLAFAHSLDHGGAQRYLFEQIRHLLSDPAVSCTVVAPQDGPWRARFETIGAEVLLASYPTEGIGEYEGAIEQLAAWGAERDFDVVLVNTLGALHGADLGHRLGLGVVWSIHESFALDHWWQISQRGEGHPYVRARLDRSLREAAALVFAAEATKRVHERHGDPARMVTAPYGLELSEIDEFRETAEARARDRRAPFAEDAVLLLCLGTVTARKAQSILAQAFAQVAADHPKARLVLVGDGGGSYSGAIRAYLDRSGLGPRCSLLPVTPDPYPWHEAADVFVLASDVESSPISILEAMAFETPVVASNVFGVPELIEDGRHGYLCEPNDIGSLARALDRALSAEPTERSQVARNGHERVRVRHDPDRYARSLRRLLDDLAEDPRAPVRWEPSPRHLRPERAVA